MESSLQHFLPEPGNPAVPWRQWREDFAVYKKQKIAQMKQQFILKNCEKTAAQIDAEIGPFLDLIYPDATKNLDLYALLGIEGQRQAIAVCGGENQISEKTHAAFIEELNSLFLPAVNPVLATVKFRSRQRRDGESIRSWITELRALATHCNFTGNVGAGDFQQPWEDYELAMMLLVYCRDAELQRKLFTMPATAKFAAVKDLCLTYESAYDDVKSCGTATGITVNAVSNKPRFGGQQANKNKKRFGQQGKGLPTTNLDKKLPTIIPNALKCGHCGREGHKSRDPKCPARDKKCNKCQTLGHFSLVCRSKYETATSTSPAQVSVCETFFPATDNRISAIFSLQDLRGKGKIHSLRLMIDTGAEISTMTEGYYKAYFRDQSLSPGIALRNFDSSPVSGKQTSGSFRLKVLFGHRSCVLRFHVVPDTCQTIIGNDGIKGLSLQIHGGTGIVSAIAKGPVPAHTATDTAMQRDSDTPLVIGTTSCSTITDTDVTLDSLVARFPTLFSGDVGRIPDFEHRIELSPDARPIVTKLRRPPVAFEEQAATTIQELLDMGIIEKIDKSEWVHPAHFVRKPNGSLRAVVDFKCGINKYVISTRHPLPLPADIFQRMGNAKYFSKLDITKAYFHLVLARSSRPLTAFLTASHGLCQYKRTPMGLKDSGAAFQMAIEKAFYGMDGVAPYVDDLFIWGKTREEHDRRLLEACSRLEKGGFRLQKAKLEIACTKISGLGHIISAGTDTVHVSPDSKNSATIQDCPAPSDVKSVQRFLGLCNYYSEFIPNLADLAEPLRRLTHNDISFQWTSECQSAFEKLKKTIASPAVLSIFDPQADTVLTTDASDIGIGAVLSQVKDGVRKPLAFASHTLFDRERHYSTPERECLAVVWACEHFQKFLLGQTFLLETDQSSLVTLLHRFGNDRKSRRIARWYDRISFFDYTVKHIPGKENVCADALSRISNPGTEFALPDDDEAILVAAITLGQSVTVDEVTRETKSDTVLNLLKNFIINGWPTKRKFCRPEIRDYFGVKDELFIAQQLIFRYDRLVIPLTLRNRILELLHSGHPGIVRMKQKMRNTYFWPGCDSQCEYFVKECTSCAASGKSHRPEPVPVTAVPPPDLPWKKLAIDIAGPFISAPTHQRFVVTIVDYFSKYPEILLTGDITSGKLIEWLDEVFSRFGNPDQLITDNGPQFISHEFVDFLCAKNIFHFRTAVYNPAQNGAVECINRIWKFGAQAIFASGVIFKVGMRQLITSFRATSPENSLSPAELLFGWKMRTDSDIRNPMLYAKGVEILQKASEIYALSVDERKKVVNKKFSKQRYGVTKEQRPAPRITLRVGDFVRYKKPASTVLKGQSPLSNPLRIVKVEGKYTFRLADGQIWNARRLTRYHPTRGWKEPEFDFCVQDTNIPLPAAQPENVIPMRERLPRTKKGVPPKRYDPYTGN